MDVYIKNFSNTGERIVIEINPRHAELFLNGHKNITNNLKEDVCEAINELHRMRKIRKDGNIQTELHEAKRLLRTLNIENQELFDDEFITDCKKMLAL